MITSPNTPKTAWVRDRGTIVETNTDVLIDESGNFLVDENGDNLLDSPTSDGYYSGHSWIDNTDEEINTSWANSFEARISTSTRTTVQGDTRTTVQGDTRTALVSDANIQNPTSWGEDEYA